MSKHDKNKTNNEGNQSEGKKIIKFIAGIMSFFLLGMVGGILSYKVKHILTNEDMMQGIFDIISKVIPSIYIVVNVVIFIAGMIIYSNAKKMVDNWNGKDEDILDIVEKKLNIITVTYNIIAVCNCFFFGTLIEIGEMPQASEMNIPFSVFVTVSFFVLLAINFMMGKKVVDLIKRINPERSSVSLFEKNFEKQWEDSSDEAQKQILYKAGYTAYRIANMVCAAVWGLTLFTLLIYKTGLFPMFCVCTILTFIIFDIKFFCSTETTIFS